MEFLVRAVARSPTRSKTSWLLTDTEMIPVLTSIMSNFSIKYFKRNKISLSERNANACVEDQNRFVKNYSKVSFDMYMIYNRYMD